MLSQYVILRHLNRYLLNINKTIETAQLLQMGGHQHFFSIGLHVLEQSTTMDKIFETISSFHVKQCTSAKVQFLIFRKSLLVLTKFSLREEEYPLRNNSMKFRSFPDIS